MNLWDALKQAQTGPIPCIQRPLGEMKVRYIKLTRNGLYAAESYGPLVPLPPALPYTVRGDDMQADDWWICTTDRLTISAESSTASSAPNNPCTLDNAVEALCMDICDLHIGIAEDAEIAERLANAALTLAQAKNLNDTEKEDA